MTDLVSRQARISNVASTARLVPTNTPSMIYQFATIFSDNLMLIESNSYRNHAAKLDQVHTELPAKVA